MNADPSREAVRFVARELRPSGDPGPRIERDAGSEVPGAGRAESADQLWQMFETTLDDAQVALREAAERNRILAERLQDSDRRVSAAEEQLAMAQQEIARFGEREFNAAEKLSRLETEAVQNEQKVTRLINDCTQLAADRDQLRLRLDTVSADHARQIEAHQADVQAAIGRMEDANSRLIEMDRLLKNREVEMERLTSELHIRRDQLTTLSSHSAQIEEELSQLGSERTRLLEQRDGALAKLETLKGALKHAENKLSALSTEREPLTQELDGLRIKYAASEQQLQTALTNVAALENRLNGSNRFFESVTPRLHILREEIRLIRDGTV